MFNTQTLDDRQAPGRCVPAHPKPDLSQPYYKNIQCLGRGIDTSAIVLMTAQKKQIQNTCLHV
jgi:hypothetical protein